jgi:hypothetical protein
MASRWVRFGVQSLKLSSIGQSLDGWPKIYYLQLFHASDGTLSRWSRLYLQSLAPTNLHWARVVGYGSFSLCVIHKERLCPSSGDINGLMMMMIMTPSDGNLLSRSPSFFRRHVKPSRLHLQSLTPTPVLRRVYIRIAAGRKNNCRIIIIT